MFLSWTVKFGMTSDLNTGGTILNDVQSVSFEVGRQWQTDPYGGGICTIRCRNISAWTVAPKIGDMIRATPGTSLVQYPFAGFIKDVAIDYGITSDLDEATITCETALGILGRIEIQNKSLAQALTLDQMGAAVSGSLSGSTGLRLFTNGLSTASAQTYSGNLLDILNSLILTELGHMKETGGRTGGAIIYVRPIVYVYQRNYDQTVNLVLADIATAADDLIISNIEFKSAAQNYYTEAIVEPQGLASQTSGSDDYVLVKPSLDYTTGQALAHAQYLVSQYSSTASQIFRITTKYSQQRNDTTREAKFFTALMTGSGDLIQVVFRGNTYYCVVQGVSVEADVEDTIVSYTVAPFDTTNYLTLDNAVFGVLGASATVTGNKLGF